MLPGSPALLITIAVLGTLGAGGAAFLRVLFVERPGGRAAETADLRKQTSSLGEELVKCRDALYVFQRTSFAEKQECEHRCWSLKRQLEEAAVTINRLRGPP